ncbi:hypothetical protein [Modestobacter sp. DSM 44400]|uniref:TlpA family protein disulfide reductase n=1 Tax=Modestobacter sp. DSM 44400 TaxID=1550230 RepID=UPI000B8693DB|nr:hypothetical protein [Modestobacter sp. DSM 44400]
MPLPGALRSRRTPFAAVSLLTDTGVNCAQVASDDTALLREFGVPGMPVALTVDTAGTVVDRQFGPASEERLDEMLDGLARRSPAQSAP